MRARRNCTACVRACASRTSAAKYSSASSLRATSPARSHRGPRCRRPDLRPHDGRPGPPNLHGSVVAVCDAVPARHERPPRHDVQLRYRPRAPRLLRAQDRADVAGPLLLTRNRLLVSPPPRMWIADAGVGRTAVLDHAPGNGATIGGTRVVTKNGWFAARPPGT